MQKIRILVVTQTDPFYLPLFFKHFFEKLEAHKDKIEVDGLIIQRPLGNKTFWGLAKRVVGLYGLPGTFIKVAQLLWLKLQDLAYTLGLPVAPNAIGLLANLHGMTILAFTDVNDSQCIEYVKSHQIDLIVSVSASQVFRNEILKSPGMGCVNLHNGDLPRYKGMLPNFWQMYNGETSSVLTIHTMEPELDKGGIILKKSTPIPKGTSLEKLIRETKTNSAIILVDWLVSLSKGNPIVTTAMDVSSEKYYSFPSRKDVKEFIRKGNRVL